MVKKIKATKKARKILVDKSKAAIGHNSGVIQPSGTDEINTMAIGETIAHWKAVEALTAKFKDRKRFWKNQGVIIQDVMTNAKLLHLQTSPEIIEQNIKNDLRIKRLCGLINAMQMTLFENPPPVDLQEKAKDDGKRAGLMGRSIKDCPHDPATTLSQLWMEWWHVGSKERAQLMDMEKRKIKQDASEAKRKAGKKSKVEADEGETDDEEERELEDA
jgi:ribosome modulation factor